MSTTAAMPNRSEAAAASGWANPVRLWQPRNPAFWLYIWLVVNGAGVYVLQLSDTPVPPSVIIASVTLQAIYAGVFVWMFGRADRYEREPAKLAGLAFLFGGLVSTWLMAAPANSAVVSLISKLVSVDFAVDWGPAIAAPLTEETSKLAAVVICVLLARQHVRSAYDGLMIGMFAGLGFQVFENADYMVSAARGNFNSQPLQDVISLFWTRSVSGLYGHWLFTAIAGAGVGYYLGNPDRSKGHRLGVAGGLLLVAMLAHSAWDAMIALGAIALVIAVLIGLPVFILLLRYTGRRTRSWVGDLLTEDRAAGVVTEEELSYLTGTLHARRKHVRSIKHSDGKPAAQRAEWVMHAQNELAAAIAATDDPHSPRAEAARSEVVRLRTV